MNFVYRISALTMGIILAWALPSSQNMSVAQQQTTQLPKFNSPGLERDPDDVPWSEAVQVVDPYEGSYPAVFDRNYWKVSVFGTQGTRQVITLWTPEFVRVLITGPCEPAAMIKTFWVKVEEQVFELEGNNNTFAVTDQLAQALVDSPNRNVDIRLILEGGETVNSLIGEKTVAAWDLIYSER
ncbi:MAG: hypothetical protein KA714_18955 [Limnoraphis sp. WC205]|uniref:hypothetical protein n=1 Tax=Limnoraphis robusta TaxID=1118279 RepID=UPI001F85D64D|nr:hypothetical protein [Limnoraphis robusta]MCG5059998.1 hypothetical protein [Limnoraphis sp. WC205]MEA5500315.1 hypothetical protein [Limnoraphis robusta BA-68 BA1]